jgi:sugar (pentulose or hexulose) kinase
MLNLRTPQFSGDGKKAVLTVAVIDIGKTNAKVALVDAETGTESALRLLPNTVRQDGPYPHFDAGRIWAFICDCLADFRRESGIDALSITTHGAAGALIAADAPRDEGAGDGLALPILDYEFSGPDERAAQYNAVRPDFAETLSPRMRAGLNLGAQLFWQAKRYPAELERAHRFVTYPQYWAWRLSGVAATECSSLGSHTDLWTPAGQTWSSMIGSLGWAPLMSPVRSAFEALGPLRPDIAARLNLDAATPVMCGIHDSNASLLPHLVSREGPFTVVSTGTWVIVLAVGGSTGRLDPAREGLAYVDAFGAPVPASRFMGGREFDAIAGAAATVPEPADIDAVISGGTMALPSFVPGSGPFGGGEGRWTVPPETLSSGQRTAAASLYLALVTAECLLIAGSAGPVIVEGPFAANRLFCAALAAIAGAEVTPSTQRTGTTFGAALLATVGAERRAARGAAVEPLRHKLLDIYVRQWREASGARQRQ